MLVWGGARLCLSCVCTWSLITFNATLPSSSRNISIGCASLDTFLS